MPDSVLVTGGAGFIGSHACVELALAGYDVTVVDNLANSRRSVIGRVSRIAGRPIRFAEGDVRDKDFLRAVFAARRFSAVVHFAGLKAVGESVAEPLRYWEHNVGGTLTLLAAMAEHGVRRIVFSSSATVYGQSAAMPLAEDAPLGPTNPYGRTKLAIEQILGDVARADAQWRAVLLRYFNPVGAHAGGTIGEDPDGVPNNLFPYVAGVAAGRFERVPVFGNDYPTPDGTGVRDYIHVMDLAAGHVAALRALDALPAVTAVNLGTGRGYSVLEAIAAFERASGRKIPFRVEPRRPGDVAMSYADPSLAARLLAWKAVRGLDDMCADAWRWQQWRAAHEAQL
ncbi:MAG TPA: UDP-glucose 4-epimerase GalE [Burkholderiales bacterium]